MLAKMQAVEAILHILLLQNIFIRRILVVAMPIHSRYVNIERIGSVPQHTVDRRQIFLNNKTFTSREVSIERYVHHISFNQ